jgi:hypothetical protein
MYFNLHLHYRSIFFLSDALRNMFIYVIHVERVHVGHVPKLCIIRSRTMHLT